MGTRTLIGAGLALALAAGVGAYSYTAVAQDGPGYGPGWMMGGGYGPGMMGGGYGPGYHMQGGGPGNRQWNCPAFGQYGRPWGPASRATAPVIACAVVMAPAYHMRGGYGPGMMGGYGPGYERRGDAQNDQGAQSAQGPQGPRE